MDNNNRRDKWLVGMYNSENKNTSNSEMSISGPVPEYDEKAALHAKLDKTNKEADSLKRLNKILSEQLVTTQKNLALEQRKSEPKFQSSSNHYQIVNDQEDSQVKYLSQPKKFRLDLSVDEEMKRRRVKEFLDTDIGRAALWDFDHGNSFTLLLFISSSTERS